MTAPKKPQDHKPKVEKVEIAIGDRVVPARRTVIRGIEVTVADEALDDFELLDDLAQLEEKKATRLPSVARRLFGDEYSTILDGIRGENGRVSIEDATEFIRDVFGAINPN